MSEESFHSEHPGGWIEWFCGLEDHNFLCEVDEDFILDPNNTFDIKGNYAQFNHAIEMILQPELPDTPDLSDPRFLEIYQEAIDIYGLIHAKYIQTPIGLSMLRERVLQGRFGECPRVYCEQQHVIPVGLSEEPKTSRVKVRFMIYNNEVYCPRCEDAYTPKKKCADMDGAYFGKTLPTLLLMTHPDLEPSKGNLRHLDYQKFTPTVFGFRVYGKTGSNYINEPLKKLENQQSKDQPTTSVKENPTQSKKKQNNQKA